MNLKYFVKKLIHQTVLFEIFFKKDSLKKSFPRFKLDKLETNDVVGWVPYIKGKTTICLYNFFSINYSIRKSMKLKFYLIDNLNIVDIYKTEIKPDEILNLDLNKIFGNKNGQILIAQLYSDQIKFKHAGNDGHLRFWGNYTQNKNSIISLVHSMPLSYNDLFLKKFNYSRNYNFNTSDKLFTQNCFTSGTELIESNIINQKVYYGYNIVTDKENNPISVWHLSPVNKNRKQIEVLQGAFCPNVEDLDPYVILDPIETGITKNNVEFYIVREKTVEDKKRLFIENFFKLKISDIFGKKIVPGYSIFMKFQSMGLSHSHIHYAINNKLSDQVHMHESNWKIENNLLKPIESKKKSNCRKFFHFYFQEKNLINLVVIHNEKVENKDNNSLKIRLFSKNNIEKIKIINIGSENPLTIININELFELKDINNGVIQIESFDFNFHASGLILNKKLNTIATDHFTGG
ncbi:hypothetical protein OA187_02060 [Candidatus Pelagibacter sp.]|nr:hypothetical protein [Candidatus Pelagibacter sp.]